METTKSDTHTHTHKRGSATLRRAELKMCIPKRWDTDKQIQEAIGSAGWVELNSILCLTTTLAQSSLQIRFRFFDFVDLIGIWLLRSNVEAECWESAEKTSTFGKEYLLENPESRMPFIGKDWRGPGNTWIRCPHTDGWEQRKLRPTQVAFPNHFVCRCTEKLQLQCFKNFFFFIYMYVCICIWRVMQQTEPHCAWFFQRAILSTKASLCCKFFLLLFLLINYWFIST